MLIGLVAGEGGGGEEEERESHSKVGTLLGPTIIFQVLRREREFCQEILWEIFIFSQFREEKESFKIISPILR